VAELNDLLARYGASLWRARLSLVLAALALALLAFALRGFLPERHRSKALAACLAVSAAGALFYAWQLRWLADDAYISFRYAANWVNGHGLVFNPGERVEGYTNFLWTVLIAAGIGAGIDPGQLSIVLTLASLVATLLVAALVVRRCSPPGTILPGALAAGGLAVNYTFCSFGTSGLETVPAACLVLAALERALAGKPLLAGTLGVLAGLAHPDHFLLYAALGLAQLPSPGPRVRRALAYGAPFLGLFVPYFLVRYLYYGDLFPNTYYAKSGGDAYFSQGFKYVGISVVCAGLLGVLPLAGFAVFRRRGALFGRFLALGVPLYLLYVAKIGGDFMLGRLLCAVLPLLLVAAELGLRDVLHTRRPVLEVLAFAAFLPLAVRNRVIPPQQDYHAICDERTWYPLVDFSPIRLEEEFSQRATALLASFAGATRPPRLAFCCVGIIGYRTGYYVLDQFGLTSREVAHMPILSRGRTGHEKVAGPGFSFESDVDFSGFALWPEPYESWVKLGVGGFDYSLAKFDRALLASASADTRVPDLEKRIREYSPRERSLDERACDVWFFEQVYFAHRPDATLERAFLEKLVKERPELAGLEELLLERAGERHAAFEPVRRFDFESFSGWSRRGDAFEAPVEREVKGQSRVFGERGRFVNSYHPKHGETPTGSLVSSKFPLQGDAITLRIGGGRKQGKEGVRLRVDGKAVESVTGCDSELLGRRVIPIAALRGRSAELEIIDRSRQGWGHVVVDEIVEWRRVP
jgi:hypothetical protein